MPKTPKLELYLKNIKKMKPVRQRKHNGCPLQRSIGVWKNIRHLSSESYEEFRVCE
jgi:hypothetical protein